MPSLLLFCSTNAAKVKEGKVITESTVFDSNQVVKL